MVAAARRLRSHAVHFAPVQKAHFLGGQWPGLWGWRGVRAEHRLYYRRRERALWSAGSDAWVERWWWITSPAAAVDPAGKSAADADDGRTDLGAGSAPRRPRQRRVCA